MQTNDLLAQLKDIYLPARVSQWWPLAYGWWLLLGLIVLTFIIFLIILHFRKKRNSYKDSIVNDFRRTIEETQQNKPKEALQNISVYLKRVALQKFPNQEIKTLHGEQWLEFLDSKMKKQNFKNTKANMLVNSYRAIELDRQTLNEILTVAEQWLRRVL
ncbi:DUF4381 domain-containing protein [Francisella noatunensis]|uniref:DUF4381 domain-containing protein n=1 Tax=Francisella noatunensis TaxID=657445 RepID=A0A9Q2KRA6_9GAMM|nr:MULTISPECIES: DUF4381 domain-containing protein [Francisella]AJI75207.1 hypothetical protein BZ13_1401 [Francisella philomiragia subsp. philomiragia ATCC 25015]EET20408.1 conserved hypothetical protein [Francisella philomiragia subsp. philomiragia ATCC 25015]MBK2029402.1 DUF4381 domain-containing protein [Francisella noatunensis]MBK2033759.1 DUF4381 domain-containing protein [Francisella noatunensis]MBK2049270.1 DUF4381 domain-containing protein [Francisella noatunensis]